MCITKPKLFKICSDIQENPFKKVEKVQVISSSTEVYYQQEVVQDVL